MTWLIVQVWYMRKSELNCHDPSDKMWYIMKRRQDNDLTDRTSVISTKYDTELSRPIK